MKKFNIVSHTGIPKWTKEHTREIELTRAECFKRYFMLKEEFSDHGVFQRDLRQSLEISTGNFMKKFNIVYSESDVDYHDT